MASQVAGRLIAEYEEVESGKRNDRPELAAAARSGRAAPRRAAQTARAASYANTVLPYIEAAQRAGASSIRLVAEALTARGIRPPSGGEVWHATQVRRILQSREASDGTPQAGR
ncbi:hypothetical protein BKE38_01850 [Pseudoroseomonas deserti]|uniref:Recombinase domain-containing protein n=2 Tax=Teichococcus deserti TaxID=1817963 RepID=A0A1V2H9Q5_9PROT|nr:hypothetical protein BKE38_01850 [Pseudoroseomonas deserti]